MSSKTKISCVGVCVSVLKAKRIKDSLRRSGHLRRDLRPSKIQGQSALVVFPVHFAEISSAKTELANVCTQSDIDVLVSEFETNGKRSMDGALIADSTSAILAALNAIEAETSTLMSEDGWISKARTFSWERHGDLMLLPRDPCFVFLRSLGFDGWSAATRARFLEALSPGTRRLLVASRVRDDGFRTPDAEMIVGDSGFVRRVDNGVVYEYDVTRCMFSSGNVSEKLRVASWSCRGETVVDLFAGIGYFALQLLVHAGARHLIACEWNPDAANALKRNLELNGVSDRADVLVGDNRLTCPVNVAHRVHLGLLPTAAESYLVAARALKTPETPEEARRLHVHENVDSGTDDKQKVVIADCNDSNAGKEETSFLHSSYNVVYEDGLEFTCNKKRVPRTWITWARKTRDTFQDLLNARRHDLDDPSSEAPARTWTCRVGHLQRVKSYGPRVDHLVADLECFYL